MIEAIDITGVRNYEVTETTRKYVRKKIGRLDRFLPAHARESVTVAVKLREVNRDHGNKYEAEVIISVPDKTITAQDSTVNMLAAIDIVEAKLKAQLVRYKQHATPHAGNRRLFSRFKRTAKVV